jgi:hypothetical protein
VSGARDLSGRTTFGRRLAVTGIGAAVGVVATLIGAASEGSVNIEAGGTGMLVAVGLAGALVEALITRRWLTAIVAAILAGAAVPAIALAVVIAACASGAACD